MKIGMIFVPRTWNVETEFFPAKISQGPDVSNISVLTIFALPNIFLASHAAHQVLLLRRLAFLVGVLLLKLPSIVRWGGAGRLLLQDEACALYNATAQPRAQGSEEIHRNIRTVVSLIIFLPTFYALSFLSISLVTKLYCCQKRKKYMRVYIYL